MTLNHLGAAPCRQTGLITFDDAFTTSPNGTTSPEAPEIVNYIVTEAFDGVMKLNDLFMATPKCSTLVEVKENIQDTLGIILRQPVSEPTVYDSVT